MNFENFASFLANYQKVIHAKFVKILESQKCVWNLLHFALKKHMRIRNEPKLLFKTPDTKFEKTSGEKSFSQNIIWHFYQTIKN